MYIFFVKILNQCDVKHLRTFVCSLFIDERILFGNLEYFALSHNEAEFVVEVLEDFQWTLCLDHLLGRHLQAHSHRTCCTCCIHDVKQPDRCEQYSNSIKQFV